MVVMWNISLIFTFFWNGNQFAFIFFINGINGFNGFNGIIWFDFIIVIVIVLLFQIFLIYVQFISYSKKCSNWHRISKLSSNFGCLFTFRYLDGANSIRTDLHICNWPVCKLQVCNLVLIEFVWPSRIAKSKYASKVQQQFRYLTPIRALRIWDEPDIKPSN